MKNLNQNQEENQVSNFEYKINYGWHNGAKWDSVKLDRKPSDEEIMEGFKKFQKIIRKKYKESSQQYMRIYMEVFEIDNNTDEVNDLFHRSIDNFKLH